MEQKLFHPAENADIMELLIKASKQKVALTAGFRRKRTPEWHYETIQEGGR